MYKCVEETLQHQSSTSINIDRLTVSGIHLKDLFAKSQNTLESIWMLGYHIIFCPFQVLCLYIPWYFFSSYVCLCVSVIVSISDCERASVCVFIKAERTLYIAHHSLDNMLGLAFHIFFFFFFFSFWLLRRWFCSFSFSSWYVMYVHFKVWPNTIEYFARAYVYYLDMDQNIAIKHTQHTQIFGRLARLWFVCVCVRIWAQNFSNERIHSLYIHICVCIFISNTITTTTHTFWNERCSCCYGFKLRKHCLLV